MGLQDPWARNDIPLIALRRSAYDEHAFETKLPKIDMRYQVELRVAALMDKLNIDSKALAAELGINTPHVARLRDDSWTTLQRADLQKLLCWGQKHDTPLLVVEPNPLWRTLSDTEVVLLRGRKPDGNPLPSDSQVEKELIAALEEEGCKITPRSFAAPDHAAVVELMQHSNCIFIGSPKFNTSSESALAALWGLEPHVPNETNRHRSPIQFIWDSGYHGQSAFGVAKQDGEMIGLQVGTRNTAGLVRTRVTVPVDWRSAKQYSQWTGKGRDAGALIACYQPLGTRKKVTTIVLAGYSGFATHDMAVDFVRDGLRVDPHELRPQAVAMRVLFASYKKESGHHQSRVRVAKGRRWFAPPWSSLRTLSQAR